MDGREREMEGKRSQPDFLAMPLDGSKITSLVDDKFAMSNVRLKLVCEIYLP